MSKATILAKIRKLIAGAQPEQAIVHLQELLATEPKLAEFRNPVIQLQAELSLFRRNKIEGIISDDEENVGLSKLNKRILDLCQEIEKVTPEVLKKRQTTMIAGGAIAVLLTVAGWFYTQSNNKDCIQFSGNENGMFKIVVYPFTNLDNSPIKPEAEIRDEINKLCQSTHFNAQAVWHEGKKIQNIADATQSAKGCDADMVIWGSFERSGDSTLLQVSYRLCKEDKWNIQNLKIQGDSGLKAVRTISSIDAGGELLSDVSTTIKLVFGMVAMYKNDNKLAVQMLESIDTSVLDSSMHILLADNYISLGRQEDALAQLDKYVQKGGRSSSAFNNRAMLNCNIGNYALAVSDLNRAAILAPSDTLILKNRAYALDKNEQYVEAERAVEVLQVAAPANQWAAKQKPKVTAKAKTARAKADKIATAKTQQAPSKKELIEQAETEFRAGKTTQALETSQRAVKAGGGKTAELLYLKILQTIDTPQKVAIAEKAAVAKGIPLEEIRATQLRIGKRAVIIPDTTSLMTPTLPNGQ